MMKDIETLIWEHGEDMPQPNVLLQSKIVVHTTVWITVPWIKVPSDWDSDCDDEESLEPGSDMVTLCA